MNLISELTQGCLRPGDRMDHLPGGTSSTTLLSFKKSTMWAFHLTTFLVCLLYSLNVIIPTTILTSFQLFFHSSELCGSHCSPGYLMVHICDQPLSSHCKAKVYTAELPRNTQDCIFHLHKNKWGLNTWLESESWLWPSHMSAWIGSFKQGHATFT